MAQLKHDVPYIFIHPAPGSHCCFNCHPEELVQAVIDLAEYEHRAEMYAKERLNRPLIYK